MSPKTQRTWRFDLAFGLLMLAVVGLCVRGAILVGTGSAGAIAQARRQQQMVMLTPARPGNIWARARASDILLASSRQVPSCYADPFIIRDGEVSEVAVKVGDALGLAATHLREMFIARRQSRFVWLKRGLSEDETAAIRALKLPAVAITHEWRRYYPNGPLAGPVLGFRRLDNLAGGGLELSQDRYLAATDGKRVMLADAFRRPIWPVVSQSRQPLDGADVYLCLDAVIQGYLQEAVGESVRRFSAKWATGVLVRPRTGEVLAMCSVPTYDPNEFNRVDANCRTNRAINMPYEPGSAAKPIFAAAAVEAGAMGYQDRIFCEYGAYRAHRGGKISDHGKSYGNLTLTDIVVHSSNIGMAKVGEKLGNERLYAIAGRFGLGRRSGIELPGESAGIVRPLGRWDGYSLRRVPFGQEISATALQLTMAFCSLANGGLLMRPRLVDRVVAPDGRDVYRSRPQVVRRVLSPQVAAQTVAVLQQVVERGTGRRCRLRQWTSFGKTGTAQIPGPGGYVEGAYVSAFVGGAPVRRPRIMCLIAVYWPDASKGYYGSVVAAPGVKEVLQRSLRYLNVPPDRGGNATAGTRGLAMGRR
ncbi:MAG: penicillin-binding protein 2 [Phycisphaerae bacterium]|nr:penicillin-binding protein 2 [Phycisphaerae bacterium]